MKKLLQLIIILLGLSPSAQSQNSGSFSPTVINGTMTGANAEYFVANNVVYVTGNFSSADFDGNYMYVDLNIPVSVNFTNESDVNGSVLGMFYESVSGYVEAVPNSSTVRLKASGAHGYAFGTTGSFVYSYKLPGASASASYTPTVSSGIGTFSNANYIVNGNIVLVNGNFSNVEFDSYGMYIDINLPVPTTFVDSFDASGIVSGKMDWGESVSGYVEAIPGTNTVRLRAAGAHGMAFNTYGSYVFSYKISSSNNSQSYSPTVVSGEGSFTAANYSTVGNVEYVSGNFSNAFFNGSGTSVDITIPGTTLFTNASDVTGSVSGMMYYGESVSGYVEAIPNTNTVRLKAAAAHWDGYNTTGSFIFSYTKEINPNLSKIIDSQCGATLPAINTLIRANAITGASHYRFKVVNGTTTEIIEPTSGRWFRLTSLPGGTFYNTTYTISVAVKRNNVWGEYGYACAVTTPAYPATKIQNGQCGSTLSALNSLISANTVTNISGYRFKVVNGATTETIETTSRWFRLTSLPNGAFYNTTYTISVATKYNGVCGEYGEECMITTPAFPATKVQNSQCGITLASINTLISANAVNAATGYRFKVVNETSTETIDAVSGSRWFRLTSLNDGALYNTTYTVSVATRYNGVWSEYGEECLITTPAAPLTKLQDKQCGITLSSGNTSLLYANPVSVAQKYRFEVSLGADTYLYDTNSNNVRSFRMTEVPGLTLVDGTTYAIKVAIMANGVWQPYGESCTITTFGDAPNFVKTMNVETTKLAIIDFNVVTYPNPFMENFNLSLTSISEEKVIVMVYDMTGKLLEKKEVVPSELSELQVGNNFASGVYNVIVSQGTTTKSIRVIKK